MKKKSIEFNKKNAIKFANKIYNGRTYTKLCHGDLRSGNLHCVIGEAAIDFLGKSDLDLSDENNTAEDTTFVIDQLVKKAIIDDKLSKNPLVELLLPIEEGSFKDRIKEILSENINTVIEVNDDKNIEKYSNAVYRQRAKNVKKAWMTKIVPLLK